MGHRALEGASSEPPLWAKIAGGGILIFVAVGLLNKFAEWAFDWSLL